MALGDPYATLAELKARVGLDPADTSEDLKLTSALAAGGRGVELLCKRQFNDAGSTSPRTYAAVSGWLAKVDDFSTTTGLVVETDDNRDGVFEITWTAADYQLEPLGGVVAGVPGWPFWRIRARSLSARRFPRCGDDALVRVTARWGWAAVHPPVKEANLIGSEDLFKLKDAPFGVGGFGEFGTFRVRDNSKVRAMLADYRIAVVG